MLILGLDGATFDLIRPWAEAGHLPTLRDLMQRGVSGDLASTLPPLTATAWPSFMTGKNPGKHGVFDFFRPTTGELVFVNASQIDGRWWCEDLSVAGLSVGLLNVPLTHPPRSINGYIIPGTPTPDEGHTTWPRDVLTAYECELGAYRISPRFVYRSGHDAEYSADLHALIDLQTRYALRLMTERPTDVVMLHFLATDSAQHALWKQHDRAHPWHRPEQAAHYGMLLRDIFAHIDRSIAQLLTQVGADTNIMVISDHGFGPLHRTINLNNFFRAHDLLTLKSNRGTRLRDWLFQHDLDLALPWKILRRLGLGQRLGAVSRIAHDWSQRKMLTFADVDWSRTVAYAWGHFGQVYINLKGREPHGSVEPRDYMAARERVSEVLRLLRDPLTHQPLVDDIIPREVAAHGPHRDEGPDLHVIMDGYRTVAYPLFAADARLFARRVPDDSGTHRAAGIFIACGPDVAQGQTIEGARLIDLAPTILHLLGTPLPTDYDGRVLVEALSPQAVMQPIVYRGDNISEMRTAITLSGDEQRSVEDRLRTLGYLG
ncbi:MAG: alkaline phosphatase family protein [Thermoflexales bacterium]|nr:alkaline phosphatase family protein [Thermoflexales bacterium]